MNIAESVSGLELKILDCVGCESFEDYVSLLISRNREKKEYLNLNYDRIKEYALEEYKVKQIILAYLNSLAVGFISGFLKRDPITSKLVYRSSYIFVLLNYRKNGIGRKLKEEQIELAKSLGAGSIETTVSEDNEASLRLQEKLGFKLFPDSLGVSYKAVKKL